MAENGHQRHIIGPGNGSPMATTTNVVVILVGVLVLIRFSKKTKTLPFLNRS